MAASALMSPLDAVRVEVDHPLLHWFDAQARCGLAWALRQSHRRGSDGVSIKEDIVLDAVLEFMDRRLFGPERLERLRDELARASGDQDDQPTEELKRLRGELKDIDQVLYRQSLRMEEHDDPRHPVVALAKERITELSTRRKTIENAIRATAGQRAQTLQAHEIEAVLNAIPDQRDTLKSATADELTEILETFDVTATYDKPNRALALAATLNPHRPPNGGRGNLQVAGAGLIHKPATVDGPQTKALTHRVEESCLLS